MADWRNWVDCPYCHKGHLQYNGHAAGTEILTVFYRCSGCGKETQLTVLWETLADKILEKCVRGVKKDV